MVNCEKVIGISWPCDLPGVNTTRVHFIAWPHSLADGNFHAATVPITTLLVSGAGRIKGEAFSCANSSAPGGLLIGQTTPGRSPRLVFCLFVTGRRVAGLHSYLAKGSIQYQSKNETL